MHTLLASRASRSRSCSTVSGARTAATTMTTRRAQIPGSGSAHLGRMISASRSTAGPSLEARHDPQPDRSAAPPSQAPERRRRSAPPACATAAAESSALLAPQVLHGIAPLPGDRQDHGGVPWVRCTPHQASEARWRRCTWQHAVADGRRGSGQRQDRINCRSRRSLMTATIWACRQSV